MTKRALLLISVMLCLALAGAALAAPRLVTVYVNGQRLSTPAFVEDGVTYVPLRLVSEALGVPVEWDATNNAVRIGPPPRSDAEEAVAMVKDRPGALMWDGGPGHPTPDDVLSHEMRCHSGAFDLNGWRAEEMGPGRHLVSFTYRPLSSDATVTTWQNTPPELVRLVEGREERGWYWEVNVPNRIVRFLSIEDFAAARTRYGLRPSSDSNLE